MLRELGKALRSKVSLPAARTSEIVEFVVDEAYQVVEETRPFDAKVDPDDALVLGEALGGRAEMFVTGNAALRQLVTVEGLTIVSPRQFWEALHAGRR